MGTGGPLDCAEKRTVRGWMDVAQADPSFLGNAAVPPGLSLSWAACSVRTHNRRHGKATISVGLLPQGQASSHALGLAVPTELQNHCGLLHTSSVTGNKQGARCVPVISHRVSSSEPCLGAASLCWPSAVS